jgi:hypothetical protein
MQAYYHSHHRQHRHYCHRSHHCYHCHRSHHCYQCHRGHDCRRRQHHNCTGAIAILFAVIASLWSAPLHAQDVSIGQILLPGEGWVAVQNTTPPPLPAVVADAIQTLKLRPEQAVVAGEDLAFAIGQKPGRVYRLSKGKVQGVDVTIDRPTALALSPDGGTLVVADADSRFLWTYRVDQQGKLSAKEKYYATQVRRGQSSANVTALTYDRAGRLYAASDLGVQVFDLQGRLALIINTPPGLPKPPHRLFFQDDRLHLVDASGTGLARRLTGTNPPPASKK